MKKLVKKRNTVIVCGALFFLTSAAGMAGAARTPHELFLSTNTQRNASIIFTTITEQRSQNRSRSDVAAMSSFTLLAKGGNGNGNGGGNGGNGNSGAGGGGAGNGGNGPGDGSGHGGNGPGDGTGNGPGDGTGDGTCIGTCINL